MKIKSIIGRADNFDLVFNHAGEDEWAVIVPPDLTDGQYVCEIYATNEIDETTYWTGILYITDGRFCCFKLIEDKYRVVLLCDRVITELMDERYRVVLLCDRVITELMDERFNICEIRRGCCK